jgi:3'(2'), 5'-bisphosphate nucleotidase
LALDASREIMAVRALGVTGERKPDGSPVCAADQRAEAIILAGLADHVPQFAVVAEEQVAAGTCPTLGGQPFILVDALDGTREFLAGRDCFTVNIALIADARPVIGAVCAPMHHRLWSGEAGRALLTTLDASHQPVETRAIRCSQPSTPLRVLASYSHRSVQTDAFIARLPDHVLQATGSSLKFCRIAEGAADLYPRFEPTMEWDTAAGDAVLRAAGGMTVTRDGAPLRYGKQEARLGKPFLNPDFLSFGNRAHPPCDWN